MSLQDISSVAQDYLKVIWSATEWGDPPISTKGLAGRLATTQANVSETLRRLADQQLVHYRPYKPATLTSHGTELAVAMVRRHRLIETFLVTTLGYEWDEVHDEAEQLEHAVSDLMIERIDQLLGHPVADPHGDPIPGPDGASSTPADTIGLPHAGPGTYTVVRISDADPQILARLRTHNIRPGAHIRVSQTPRSAANTHMTGPHGQPLTVIDAAAGTAPALVDTRGGWFLGRVCGFVDHLKFDRGEFPEASLPASAVVLGFDPDHDRQA